MMEQPKIAILLATYNGSRFLSAQLDSIVTQSYRNYVVLVRDDCSADDTLAILQQYVAAHPTQINLLPADATNLGASGSFSRLLNHALEHKHELGLEHAYMMFCDQDDVWRENKIETEVAAMLKAEAGNRQIPVLVHSDLEVVSESLTSIAPSFMRYQGLEIQRNQFNSIAISNLVTGCTALINEALAQQASPVSAQAIMHDWWLALVASAFGKLVYLDTPLVRYRQHGRNTIGAKEHAKLPVLSLSLWQRLFTRKPNEHLFDVALQARAFLQQYGSRLSKRQRIGLRITAAMNVRIGILQRIFYRLARRF